jgi:hypothetical protein
VRGNGGEREKVGRWGEKCPRQCMHILINEFKKKKKLTKKFQARMVSSIASFEEYPSRKFFIEKKARNIN